MVSLKQVGGSVLKLAAALSIAGVVVAGVVAGGVLMYEYKQELDAKPFETPVRRTIDASSLGFKLEITTKHSDYSMKFILKGDGYPFYFSDPALRAKNLERTMTITGKGADGFKVAEVVAPFKDYVSIVGADGKPVAFSYEGSQSMSLDDYKLIDNFELTWNFETVPVAKAQEAKSLDHCAPGISKAERLRRLEMRGPVRLLGENNYAAGSSSLLFFYDGSLLTCN